MTERSRVPEIMAGYLATFSIFLSALAVVYRPVRLAPVAIILALLATTLATERNDGFVRIAVYAGIAGWLLGMTAAVVTDSPLW